jgi:hypothetical protein
MEAHEITREAAFAYLQFGGGTDDVVGGGPYWARGSPSDRDLAALINDMQAGVPLAVDLYTQFVTWRLTR